MPFVAARRAPPGTVLVVEVGLIDVRRDNGRCPHTRPTPCACSDPNLPSPAHRLARTPARPLRARTFRLHAPHARPFACTFGCPPAPTFTRPPAHPRLLPTQPAFLPAAAAARWTTIYGSRTRLRSGRRRWTGLTSKR
eukprot:scaffold6621_cov112-Isochrysis_galbana.AAC.2